MFGCRVEPDGPVAAATAVPMALAGARAKTGVLAVGPTVSIAATSAIAHAELPADIRR